MKIDIMLHSPVGQVCGVAYTINRRGPRTDPLRNRADDVHGPRDGVCKPNTVRSAAQVRPEPDQCDTTYVDRTAVPNREEIGHGRRCRMQQTDRAGTGQEQVHCQPPQGDHCTLSGQPSQCCGADGTLTAGLASSHCYGERPVVCISHHASILSKRLNDKRGLCDVLPVIR